ncbi:MAG: RNA polymerase sigma factor [Vampirovibrionia bacterium]
MADKYRILIEKIVKSNSRYKGNEDLFEDFCSEAFKRCYKILSTDDTIVNFEAYLHKVASSAILDVLRSSGRLRRLKSGYKQIKTESLSQPYNTDEQFEIIYDIEDPTPGVEDKAIKQDEIKTIRETLVLLDNENKDKYFMQIFKMRYIEGKKQSDIATELNISQGEVSKRLIDLAKRVLSHIHN